MMDMFQYVLNFLKHTEKYDKSDNFPNSQVFIYFVSSFLEKRKHSLLPHMG